MGSVGVGHEELHGRELEVRSCSEKAQEVLNWPVGSGETRLVLLTYWHTSHDRTNHRE